MSCTDYVQILRIGEASRDATDKVRGFLYQDILALEIILNAKDDDKIYVEWVEDIFIENKNSISMYQVKHYPQSIPKFDDIFKNMFYQFLKYKLFQQENNEKNFNAYCFCHTRPQNYHEISDEEKRELIKRENEIQKINKFEIEQKLEQCSNLPERIALMFDEIASTKYLQEFNFKVFKRDDITTTRDVLKADLYNQFYPINNISFLQNQNIEHKKNMLMAVAIQYIQSTYYSKSDNDAYLERCMTKASFFEYLNKIIGVDEVEYTNTIKFIILGYIDDLFSDLQSRINAELYREIYFSTKQFFMDNLNTPSQRFKFLNSISTNKYSKLNSDDYSKDIENEIRLIYEHKDKIIGFLKITWKLLFNIDCNDFKEFFKEFSDCYMFQFEGEKMKPAILLYPGDDTEYEASMLFERVLYMRKKPKKWYFCGNYKGKYKYSFNVNKIDEARSEEFDINNTENDSFYIECMDCVKYNFSQMEKKDEDLNQSVFNYHCIKGGINGIV